MADYTFNQGAVKMKKLLCLVLSVVMTLSCFGMCLTASANDDTRPEEVSKVIDPIMLGTNTEFANGINKIGYVSANSNITKDQFNKRLNLYTGVNIFPADDKMFGVNFDFLYNNDTSAFIWDFCRYELATDPEIHQKEIAQTAGTGKRSTCQAKGMYDACSAVLYGYDVNYPTKSIDTTYFENIIETKNAVYNPNTGKTEAHYTYTYNFDEGQFSLMRSTSNYLLKKVVDGSIGNGKIYETKAVANANAIKLANFIGNLLYTDFVNIPADTEVFDDEVRLKDDTFFRTVAELSGLDDILHTNWVNAKNFDVKKVMSALGVSTDDNVILDVELTKGNYMAGRILADMYRSFLDSPVGYITNLVKLFCRNYESLYSEAMKSLFIMKFPEVIDRSRASGDTVDSYTGNELSTVDGFFNFIADCLYFESLDAGKTDAVDFDFAPLPKVRFGSAADANELYLYMLCYFNINRSYENNASAINKFISSSKTYFNKNYSAETKSTDISNVMTLFDDIFCGNITLQEIKSFYLGSVTADVIVSFPDNFMSNIKNAIANLIQSFITAMDNFMNLLFGWTDGLFDKNK